MPGFVEWVTNRAEDQRLAGLAKAFADGSAQPSWSAFEVRLWLADQGTGDTLFDIVDEAETLRIAETTSSADASAIGASGRFAKVPEADLTMTVETSEGPVRVFVARQALRSLAGRTSATVDDLLDAYRGEIEDVAKAIVDRRQYGGTVRVTAADLPR